MKTHRWVQITVVVTILALLAAGGVSHTHPPVSGEIAEFVVDHGEGATTTVGQPEAQPGDVPEGLSANDWATMQDLMRQAQYQFAWQVSDGDWAYRAPNRAHDLALSLAADGLHVTRYSAEGESLWDFGLSLAAYGAQTFPAAVAGAGLSGSRERVEYQWGQDVVEWYANSAAGLEHGLTLTAPPTGTAGPTIELAFALRGSLTPELGGGGQALCLKDASGEIALLYDRLTVYDAEGKALPAHFSLSADGESTLHLVIDATNAAYPLTVSPLLHSELAKLTASDAADEDFFGISVAISGDTVVVGAEEEDGAAMDRGAAYVFTRNEGAADQWGQVTKLVASDAASGDRFGCSVAISGDTIVVGAYRQDGAGYWQGAAYVFVRNQGGADQWGQVVKLTAADAEDWDYFGHSVAISGDTLVVAAYREGGGGSGRGAAYVFVRNQGGRDNWGQVEKLTASDAEDNDWFGYSVAISGDTVVVGAMYEDGAGDDSGAAYVFTRNEGGMDNWGQVAKLTASDAAGGDRYGVSVAISGDTIVVGAHLEDGAGTWRGAAYVYERNQDGADQWGQVTKLTASDAQNYDYFGRSVAISGDIVIVGASGEGGEGSERGAVYVFERNQGGADYWGQVEKLTASDAEDDDWFGSAVAISGNTIVVGAPHEDSAGSDRGAAYLFAGDGQWEQVAISRASDPQNYDLFGSAVAISGDTVVVGAPYEDGAGTDRGAAYVFTRNQGGADGWGQVEKLVASDPQNEDYFGSAVGISGDTVVVGAPYEDGAGTDRGAAYVYERNEGGMDNWNYVTKLTATDAQDSDRFGHSVAISGDTIAVGAHKEDGVGGTDWGKVYVFERNEGGADNWGLLRTLTSSELEDNGYFGISVAISGDTLVVGASGEDGAGSDRGAAYVFAYNRGDTKTWGPVARLVASDAQDDDLFGTSVSISGSTIVVGAHREDGAGSTRGAVYVYERNQGGADNWGQVAKLTASDAQNDDLFGAAVSISGDAIVVGAYQKDEAGSNCGAAYVFQRNQGGADNWGQVIKLTASDAAGGDNFGKSVAISGRTIVVGAYYENGAGSGRGASYVFVMQPYQIYLPFVLKN